MSKITRTPLSPGLNKLSLVINHEKKSPNTLIHAINTMPPILYKNGTNHALSSCSNRVRLTIPTPLYRRFEKIACPTEQAMCH